MMRCRSGPSACAVWFWLVWQTIRCGASALVTLRGMLEVLTSTGEGGPVMQQYASTQFVGIDLHRRRSVVVRMDGSGQVLEATRIVNARRSAGRRAQPGGGVLAGGSRGHVRVVLGVDALEAAGAGVHLADPLGVKAFEYRRVKDDVRDACDLADLLRMGRLPEAWIAPPATRELREQVRHRAKLVALRSRCKAEVHAVLATCGVPVTMPRCSSPRSAT